MPLDILLTNTYLENLGTTFTNLTTFYTNIIFINFNLNFELINKFTSVLNLWPTWDQMNTGVTQVYFSVLTSDTYFQTLSTLYRLSPHFYSFDYLHLYYAKQVMYKCMILSNLETSAVIYKSINYNVNIDIIFFTLLNKWAYVCFIFLITYFFTNIIKFRYQYGFNFYFNYFKSLSDLGEQEYGSYDDFKFFLFFLIQMFVWYCWVLFVGYTFSVQSDSKLILLTISVMITILSIPVRLLWDFGLAFGMYVRGASSSSNLVVEAFFDIIGVIIIFTRFIVQNIRFLLVFVAFFELFEWVSVSFETSYLIKASTPFSSLEKSYSMFEPKTLFISLIVVCKTIFIYIYHLLHLIIVSFMKIGVYLMVSFWLFFFLYTSFFKSTIDNYFFIKRNV